MRSYDLHVRADQSMTTYLDTFRVTRKNLPNVYKKLPKNYFARKLIDFDIFTKIA